MRIVDVDENIVRDLERSEITEKTKNFELCNFLAIEEKDGKIIAAGGIGGLFNVPSLYIAKKFQGQGIGKILLRAIIEEAKRRGYSYISGSRNPKNVRAIKLHDFYGFYPVFRIHYCPGWVRDVIILILRPKGKIVARFFSFFNMRFGTILLSIALKIAKPLFGSVLTYPPEKFPNPSISYMIKNFEKLYVNHNTIAHNA